MSDVYNLQVKISKETEAKLRKLAAKDKRKLSSYVRVMIENLVEDIELSDLEKESLNKEKESESDTTEKKQIPTNQTNQIKQEDKIIIKGKPSSFNKFGGR